MITLWTRLNAVFFYATTVLVFLGLGTAVTTLWLPSKPVVSQLRISKLLTLRPQQESIRRPDLQDRAIFTFDLDAGAFFCAFFAGPACPNKWRAPSAPPAAAVEKPRRPSGPNVLCGGGGPLPRARARRRAWLSNPHPKCPRPPPPVHPLQTSDRCSTGT